MPGSVTLCSLPIKPSRWQQLAPSLEQCCRKLPEIAERIPHFQPMTV